MNDVIKKIELDLGGKKVVLTLKQAQNLKDALDELFGAGVVYIPYERRWDYWQWRPNYWMDGTTVGPFTTTNDIQYCSTTSTLSLTG